MRTSGLHGGGVDELWVSSGMCGLHGELWDMGWPWRP